MLRHRSIARIVGLFLIVGGFYISIEVPRAQASTLPLHPIEIDIPSIQAKIPIIKVGVTSTNNMDVPHNFVQAGWYENSPVPGKQGNALIDGHVDNGGAHPTVAGVFKHLDSVVPGDVVSVRQSDGTVASFKVTNTAVYSYSKFPSALVFGQTNKALLNIITCHGTWLASADTYSQRLVVTAERV